MQDIIRGLLEAALLECCPRRLVGRFRDGACMRTALGHGSDDLAAYVRRDPAAGDPTRVAQACTSFRAVLHYRLARAWLDGCDPGIDRQEAETLAALLSCRGKLLSGAEIHPHARIGHRFVLDHGWGTVIGQTAELGDDCYLLGGVTLGAAGIADNAPGRRHPQLGNRVEVGAYARVFGAVTIGDDVSIGPHCVVNQDLAPGSVVRVKTTLQVTRLRGAPSRRVAPPGRLPAPNPAPSPTVDR
ncbi:serine O-acetyltransferase [Chitinasiproducens palmae]|uniref:serine O-acetyltransferase n=1 Tax=Chitinasiproducens palmae TaxID=1770053 RepID=A0A1H2PU95_9BURK|nr:serine O-acetyltransferase [Chitinasiproducens palmae]SDV50744.1 serine O-acetyltransferase [Chitinasiproducens palmae]